MTTTLRTLLDRVEKGEGADREIDVQLAYLADYTIEDFSLREIVDRDGLQSMVKRVETSFNSVWRLLPAYTSSIDAAVDLVEKVLPGWIVGYEPRYYEDGECVRYRAILSTVDWSRYTPHGDHVTRTEDVGRSATPARAILAALLRAKIAQEERA